VGEKSVRNTALWDTVKGKRIVAEGSGDKEGQVNMVASK
jgi:hypothetical protein